MTERTDEEVDAMHEECREQCADRQGWSLDAWQTCAEKLGDDLAKDVGRAKALLGLRLGCEIVRNREDAEPLKRLMNLDAHILVALDAMPHCDRTSAHVLLGDAARRVRDTHRVTA